MDKNRLRENVNHAASGNGFLSPGDAESMVVEIVALTRDAIARSIMQGNPGMTREQALGRDAMEGYSGFAQCIVIYGLRDCGIEATPFASRGLPGSDRDYVSVVVPLNTTQGKKYFLVDPTLINQDCGAAEQSATYRKLIGDGYVELSPRSAHEYISLFGGQPGTTEDAALDFMKNPPRNRSNYSFGPTEICHWAIRLLP